MRALLPLAAALLLASAPARAEVEVLGFSPNGKYAVLLEHGVEDGSGFPWAKAIILDTARNQPAQKPVAVALHSADKKEAEATEQARRAVLEAVEKLKAGPLRKGKEIAHDDKGELHEAAGPPIGNVEIKTRPARAKEGAGDCPEPFSPLLVTVLLHWMDDDTPARLLAEKKVPKERACSSGCTLGKVVADGRSAVFLLRCGVPGFEGEEQRSFPIAARLAYGLDEDLPGSDKNPSP